MKNGIIQLNLAVAFLPDAGGELGRVVSREIEGQQIKTNQQGVYCVVCRVRGSDFNWCPVAPVGVSIPWSNIAVIIYDEDVEVDV